MSFVDPSVFVVSHGGGVLGSFMSVVWWKETFIKRLVLFLGGWIFSVGAAPEAARRLPYLGEGFFLTFMLGFCSMVIFAKVFETWQKFNLAGITRDWARKRLGLPPVATTPVPLTKE